MEKRLIVIANDEEIAFHRDMWRLKKK